jgi:ribonuclease HI
VTVSLLDETAKLRERFESTGGTVLRISGDENPADLGFHR